MHYSSFLLIFVGFISNIIALQCNYNVFSGSIINDNYTCESGNMNVSKSINISINGYENNPNAVKNYDYIDTHTFIYNSGTEYYKMSTNRVKVAAITMGISKDNSNLTQRLLEAVNYLNIAGKNKVDIAVLPEEFATNIALNLYTSNITTTIQSLAKKYNMYIVYGMRIIDPNITILYSDLGPIGFNVAVLINRTGNIIGYQGKQFPATVNPNNTVSTDGYPWRNGTKIFDLPDIGRIAMSICFDAMFTEVWHEAYAQNTQIMIWPSAYGGGIPLRAFASLYQYYIIPVGWGDIRDITGEVVNNTQKVSDNVFIATLDLDRVLVHTDYNRNFIENLLNEYKGLIVNEVLNEYCSVVGNCEKQSDFIGESNFYLLSRTDKGYNEGISVRKLLKDNNILDLHQYQFQNRKFINMQRQSLKAHNV
eukprot:53237_1